MTPIFGDCPGHGHKCCMSGQADDGNLPGRRLPIAFASVISPYGQHDLMIGSHHAITRMIVLDLA